MSNINNSKEITLKIIELYRANDILWDMKSPNYRRTDLKERTFEGIASEMNLSCEEVKKKIKSLRTAYLAEKKKVSSSAKSGCSSDSVYEPTLYWFEDMKFLDDSIVHRNSIDNRFEAAGSSTETPNYDSNDSYYSQPMSASSRKRAKREEPTTSQIEMAVNKLVELNNKEDNEFELFGASVGVQLKNMDVEQAYNCMTDLQIVLRDYKLRAFKEKPTILEVMNLN